MIHYRSYSGFRSYEVHLSPLIACGEQRCAGVPPVEATAGLGFFYFITPGSAIYSQHF
jgi:hypothetical protein